MPIRLLHDDLAQLDNEKVRLFGLPEADPSLEVYPPGLSFCMIMKNEERFLEACLRSIATVADEICIVDTGSTDRSIEIAESFGAKILRTEWPHHFAKARNMSLEMATYRWILTLDADEEVIPESLFALREIKNAPAALTSVSVRIHNTTNDAIGESTVSHYLPRLFPNTSRIRYIGAVHERLVVDGTTGVHMVDSPIAVLHHGYKTEIIEGRQKTKRNYPLIEQEAKEHPEDTFCLFNLAMVQLSLGKSDESIETFERMFEIAERNQESSTRAYMPPAHVALATAYAEHRQDFDKALEILERCLEATPYFPNALFFKANIHAIQGDIEESRRYLREAVNSQEYIKAYAFVDEAIPLWRAKYYLALSYVNTKEYDTAFSWFDRAIQARPEMYEIRLAYARALEDAGKKADAEKAFAELSNETNIEGIFIEYLRALMRLKRYAKVLTLVGRINPEETSDEAKMHAYLIAASAACRLGSEEGEHYLQLAVAIQPHPRSGDLLTALDELYLMLGKHQERDELRNWELHERPPCFTENDYLRRSFRYLESGDNTRAVEAVAYGLRVAPKSQKLLYNGATAKMQLGEFDDALQYVSLLEPYPDQEIYLRGTYLRAMLLNEQHRYEEAIAALDGILRWEPEQLDALNFRATLLQRVQRFEEAESTLKTALALGAPFAAVELAKCYLVQGRYAEAQEVAEQALGVV